MVLHAACIGHESRSQLTYGGGGGGGSARGDGWGVVLHAACREPIIVTMNFLGGFLQSMKGAQQQPSSDAGAEFWPMCITVRPCSSRPAIMAFHALFPVALTQQSKHPKVQPSPARHAAQPSIPESPKKSTSGEPHLVTPQQTAGHKQQMGILTEDRDPG